MGEEAKIAQQQIKDGMRIDPTMMRAFLKILEIGYSIGRSASLGAHVSVAQNEQCIIQRTAKTKRQ